MIQGKVVSLFYFLLLIKDSDYEVTCYLVELVWNRGKYFLSGRNNNPKGYGFISNLAKLLYNAFPGRL